MPRQLALLLITCGAALLGGCWAIDGNAHRGRETRDHRDFVRVENNGQLDVQIRRGDEHSVEISIDSNLLDKVETHVRDETLIIDSDPQLFDYVSGPHVLVTMPHLVFGRMSGSGRLDARGFDEEEGIRLELSGSGDVFFEGSAPRIEGDVDGSGELRLAGSTDFAQLVSSGSGEIDARDLDAGGLRLRSSGSGEITATAHGEVEAETLGSGDIDIYGDAHLTSAHERGSGDIHTH